MERSSQRLYRAARFIAAACLAAGALGLAAYLGRAHTEAQAWKRLAGAVSSAAASSPQEETDAVLAAYAALARENADLAGWVRVPDTGIDYPVMQTPGEPQFYLRRAFDKSWAISGTPFADAACRLDEPGENILIYGHNMQTGALFAPLAQYRDPAFFAGHATVEFDTLTHRGIYRVFAVVAADADAPLYQPLAGAGEETFRAWTDWVARHRLYDAGPLPAQGQRVVTLSTCDNVHDEGRVAVLAAEVDPGGLSK